MIRKQTILRCATTTIALCGALVTLESSAEPSTAASPPSMSPPEDSRRADVPSRASDDLLLEIDSHASGFGGLYLDEKGEANVHLGNPANQDAVLTAVGEVLRAKGIGPGTIHVRAGRHDFSELARWKADLNSVQDLPGVVFTDIDESANRIKIGIESGADRSAIEDLIAAIGVPQNAVSLETTEPYRMLTTVSSQFRPLVGGVQIGFNCKGKNCYVCTDGFLAAFGGISGFVTCSHCTGKLGIVDGMKYSQPSPNSSSRRIVGAEAIDPSYFIGGSCPPGRRCRLSDTALVETRSSVRLRRGFIARPPYPTALSIAKRLPRFRILAVDSGTIVGELLAKIGRTTGWTQGTVTNTCVDVNVSGTDITLLCQDLVSAKSAPGDSGSPVFRILSGVDVRLYGILWGGDTSTMSFAFSPMSSIQQSGELGPLLTCDPTVGC